MDTASALREAQLRRLEASLAARPSQRRDDSRPSSNKRDRPAGTSDVA
ncbi:MAG: hypothetical protein VKI93_01180 [Synechococcus sp.]|nr:hypothetical protein [Synechococcus sp.]